MHMCVCGGVLVLLLKTSSHELDFAPLSYPTGMQMLRLSSVLFLQFSWQCKVDFQHLFLKH